MTGPGQIFGGTGSAISMSLFSGLSIVQESFTTINEGGVIILRIVSPLEFRPGNDAEFVAQFAAYDSHLVGTALLEW